MCRDPIQWLRFRAALASAALLVCLLVPVPARAGAYTYDSGQQRTVNAGILLLDADPATPKPGSAWPDKDPYVFYVLNQRSDIRPYGWNIINPLAPKSVTNPIKTRWDARDAANSYALGQIVTPNMAAYWEVPLAQTAAADLLQYDILLLNLDSAVSLTAAETESLRRFVDGGGTLWVENSGGGDISNNGPLFFSVAFTSSGAASNVQLPPGYRHPVISSPYLLSEAELSTLGYKNLSGDYQTFPATAGIQDGSTLLSGVLLNSASNAVVSAGQMGAGEVVVTSTGTANAINEYVTGPLAVNVDGANSGAYCGDNYAGASTQDLKFLSNIISWLGAHPSEHQNSRQTGNAVNALASAVRTWNFPVSGGTAGAAVPGAAINGSIAYVTDAKGIVHAFDTIPGEDLDGNGNPDDGIADYGNGTPYDQLWATNIGANAIILGSNTSAPTLAYDPTVGKNVVLVEQANGKVRELDANTGKETSVSPLAGSGGPNSYGSGGIPGPAPAPTFYNGRVYAGQPDTTINATAPSGSRLFVYDLARGGPGTLITLNQNPVVGEYVIAPPAVGTVAGENGTDILATVTTNQAMYSVFLGARGETLKDLNGVTATSYNTKLPSLNPSAYMDTGGTASAVLRTYTLNAGLPMTAAATASQTAPNFTFSGATVAPFGDYDVDFAASAAAAVTANTTGPLTRLTVSASSSAIAPPTNTVFSAPAFDRTGNIYYTVNFLTQTSPVTNYLNSSLVCAHDSATANHATLPWRFRLPNLQDGAITDADGVDYSTLVGYQFVGAPVVDSQGFVYALASNGAGTAILCFNTNASVSVDVFDPATGTPVGGLTFTQPVPPNGANTEFGDTNTFQLLANQYIQDVNNPGHVVFTSFAQNAGRQLYPDFSEPQAVTAAYSTGSPDASNQTTVVRPLHTNLAWMTTTGDANKLPAAGTGLTLVGNRLYYGTASGVQGVVADPLSESGLQTDTPKHFPDVQPGGKRMFDSSETSGVGAITAVPSSSHGVMLLNGPGGISALTDRLTVVTDNNRVMEVDGSGDALWAVDATTRTALAGGAAPDFSAKTGPGTGTGQYATSTVELNRPNSLTELSPNDYLVADTGNNRCVRFDRSGQVVWELSSFTDTASAVLGKAGPLLAPGEPLTLNQPGSVQIYHTVDASNNTTIHYLVADSGNYRVVEIDDVFSPTNQPLETHQLVWVSRTADKQNRQYRYQSAAYFVYSGKVYVITLVTNTRVAAPPTPPGAPTGALAPANADAPGGSIVFLDYDPTGANAATQANGYVSTLMKPLSNFQAKLNAGRFDIDGTVKGTAGTLTTLQVRNPRYLKAYTLAGATTPNFLLADDNGVFDIVGTTFVAQWGFTQADYQAMQAPISGTTPFAGRAALPFVPASLQRVSTDDVTVGGTDYLIGHYLISQSYSQGDPTSNVNAIGGEVFEVNTLNNGGTLETDEVHYDPAMGTYSGHTASRPANTSPLAQPTFAYRLQ